jgi:hypothetical protein
MRYRQLTASGDSTFCSGYTAFYVDVPAAVAQSVETRLKLLTGEWFLDFTVGTPYSTQVVGKYTQATADAAIKARILATQGVVSLISYSSTLNRSTRTLTVSARVDTVYGPTDVVAQVGGSPSS